MKQIILFFLFCIYLYSCTDKKQKITIKNNNLINCNFIVDSLKKNYVVPIEMYKKIKSNELILNPNISLNSYEKLTQNYPNTIWDTLAKERIYFLNKYKKYWNKTDNWNLLKIKPKMDAMKTIDYK